jgi:hypothetical protein
MSARQRRKRQGRRQEHSAATSTTRRLVVAGGLTAGATLAMSGVAQAAPMTFFVGTSADPGSGTAVDCTTPTNSDCSLRQAIDEANTNADTGDTILFNSSLSGSTISLDSGSGELPTITTGLAIQGPGASQLSVDAGGNSRIFDIDLTTAYQPVSISGLTVTNGYETSNGAAIANNNADLTISNAVVSDSTAYGGFIYGGGVSTDVGPLMINSSTVSGNYSYQGGGIGSASGAVTIANSTVSGNTAVGQGSPNYDRGYGGGVWTGSADLTVDRSTIDDNVAHDGGATYASGLGGAAIVLRNSTIANNHAATDDGGGIWSDDSDSTLTVIGSTVTGNTALTDAGGIEAFNHTDPVLQDSIVSGNTSGSDPATDDLEGSTSPSYPFDTAFSLIGVPSGYVNETVPGSNLTGVDPQLGSLANNGGPTQTELPADTSPVVNKGMSFGLSTDQRGLTRPVAFPGVSNSTAAGADGADMGAVELQLTAGPPSGGGGSQPSPGKDPKCKKLHKKLKRQKHRLKGASGSKRSMIEHNIGGTKSRLRKLGC